MAKINLRQKAFELRRRGMSYTQIKSQIGVSKSTLSLWLRKYPLSKKQIYLLRDVSEVRIEKFRATMTAKREKRIADLCDYQKSKYLPLSRKELLIAGLFLYWGEGGKDLKRPPSVHNSNPQVIKFALYWYTEILKVPREKIKVNLHLYSDMEVSKELAFWSKELNIPTSQFIKPYVKQSKRIDISHKGGFGHGTCGLVVNSISLKEEIMTALKVVADYYSNQI